MPRTRTRSAWVTTTRASKRGGTYRHWRRVRIPPERLFALETGATPRGKRANVQAIFDRVRPLPLRAS